ncbi:MAG: hypothetical protein JXR51_16600 [Bacteroidales bacterium]|nr:hypothetical protein [Bacteroidales bacterium]MBN2758788.1 hypothetical protein [Bacteroidales bacterium]
MIKKIIFAISIVLLLPVFSCNNSTNEEEPPHFVDDDAPEIDEDAINKVLESFSSPVELAALIKDLKVPFSKKYLASPDDADDYDTNFKKALGLGILSADLGYLNVYAKTSEIVNYLAVIKKISDDLNIGQFFDFQTLKRLATNNDNMDSLMFLSVSSFHQMDEHLRKNGRSNLSALVVTGVWMEGLYLSTQIMSERASPELFERIGEQKMILEQIYNILEVYQERDKNFERVVKDFAPLKEEYEKVQITYVIGESRTVVIDGQEVIISGDQSKVIMSDEQLKKIISLTEQIRNKLISL